MRVLRLAACRLSASLALVIPLSLGACVATTPRVVKIGLVAPFEGRYRQIGYDVIPAARLALREYLVMRPPNGNAIEIVAYDDEGDPSRATEQARKLAADPEVKVVIGHWRNDTTKAALPVYQKANLSLITYASDDLHMDKRVLNLAPSWEQLRGAAKMWVSQQAPPGVIDIGHSGDVELDAQTFLAGGTADTQSISIGGPDWGLSQFYALTDGRVEGNSFVTGGAMPNNYDSSFWTPERAAEFIRGFEEGSLGAPPGVLSVTAYEATWLAIAQVTGIETSEASSLVRLPEQFDGEGRLIHPPLFIFRWENGKLAFVARVQ